MSTRSLFRDVFYLKNGGKLQQPGILRACHRPSPVALIGLLGTGEAKPGQGATVGGRGRLYTEDRAGIRQCGRDGSLSA